MIKLDYMTFFSPKRFIVFVLLAVMAFGVQRAHANSYVYNCVDGGTITTYTGLSPAGPFVTNAHTAISATAQIVSTCSTKNVSVSAANNVNASDYYVNGGLNASGYAPIISATIGPGPYPSNGVPASTTFYAANADGTYSISFKTGVDDTQSVGPLHGGGNGNARYDYDGTTVLSGTPTSTDPTPPPGNMGGKAIIKVNGTVVCDTSDPNLAHSGDIYNSGSVGYDTSDCGSYFYTINSGDVVNVTLVSYEMYYNASYKVRQLQITNNGSPVYTYDYSQTGSTSGCNSGNPSNTAQSGTCNTQSYTFTVGASGGYQVNYSFMKW